MLIVLLQGCADDLRNRNIFESGESDAVITFYVEGVSLTRGEEAEDKESVVDHAYLLFYLEEASLERDLPVAAVRAEAVVGNAGSLKFKMPSNLKSNTDYQILAVANADDYLPSGFNSYREYIESWCRNASQDDYNPLLLYSYDGISLENKSCLPMSGSLSENSVFRFSHENGTYNVSASLTFRRLVARIDVANIVKEGFKIEGIALCNWRDAVDVQGVMNGIGIGSGSIHKTFSGDSESVGEDVFFPMPDPSDSGIQQIDRQIYCFPSSSNKSYLGDSESTALIIKAKYGDDDESTYYRVNVGMIGNVSKVEPNKKYLVTIQSVNGRGASTPEEAYASTESAIMLSVVEDWDLDGNNFDMDDKGNFIVLSRSSINFEGDVLKNEVVKVLTSKGLSWNVEYVADNEESAAAFSVTKLSDSAISIGPNGENETAQPLTGKCRFFASTEQGGELEVNISLFQDMAEEKPYVPVIPENMPLALIPVDGERVKIDHDAKTIEIDAFDPDCFNSFIDIPFKVYIKDASVSSVNVSSTLQWPLEGRVSLDIASQYSYCKESFVVAGAKGVLKSDGTVTTDINLGKSDIQNVKDQTIYISVGAMGPDDPAIVDRIIKLTASNGGESIDYHLILRPRQAIIDDVILNDGSGNAWLIMDRNMQDFTQSKYVDFIGIGADGKRLQAYNYTSYFIRFDSSYAPVSINIPFKFRDSETNFTETEHSLYLGKVYQYKDKNLLMSNDDNVVSISSWLKKYCDSNESLKTSPFYKTDNFQNWVLPSESVLELCRSKLKVSKMRMFLVSDVLVKNGRSSIPICCYLPYHCLALGEDSNDSYGYYASIYGTDPEIICLLFFDYKSGKLIKMSSSSQRAGLTRLVRPLTNQELIDYKENYLGYGSQPHKLTICHPDTYGSPDWFQ